MPSRPLRDAEANVLPDLLIFDCDGVLIDSEVLAVRVSVAELALLGHRLDPAEFQRLALGRSRGQWMAALEAWVGAPLPADLPDRMAVRLAAAFEAELRAMPGIEATLDALPQPRCVASSSAPERLRHTLSLTGLWERFAPDVFSASEVARGKPAPDLFLHAAARMGVPAARAVVIEDSPAGVEAGVAAGMAVLGFTGGSHCGPDHAAVLRAAGATIVFDDLRALPGLLRRL